MVENTPSITVPKAPSKTAKEKSGPPREAAALNGSQVESYLQTLKEQMGTKWSAHGYVMVADPPELEGVTRVVLGRMYCATQRACGECLPCRQIAGGEHTSVRLVEPDGASIKIEQIREMQVTLNVRDLSGGEMAVVIVPADKMGVQASNALLKTLEEPPGYVKFFLVTARPALLLPTILSRCQVIRFPTKGISVASPEAAAKADQLVKLVDRLTWETFDEALTWFKQSRGEWDRAFASDVAEALLQAYRQRWRTGERGAVRMIPHVEWIRSQLVKNMNVVLCLEQFCIKALEERIGLPKKA